MLEHVTTASAGWSAKVDRSC